MLKYPLPLEVAEADDWVDFLSDILDVNPELNDIKDRFEEKCHEMHHKMIAKGLKSEDVKEILMLTDWMELLQVETVNAVGMFLEKRNVRMSLQIEIPKEPDADQQQYLKLLQQKYHASLGCQMGGERFPKDYER